MNNCLSHYGGQLGGGRSLKIHCLREQATSKAWQDCRPFSQWVQLMLPVAPNNNMRVCSKRERKNLILSVEPQRRRKKQLFMDFALIHCLIMSDSQQPFGKLPPLVLYEDRSVIAQEDMNSRWREYQTTAFLPHAFKACTFVQLTKIRLKVSLVDVIIC